MICVPCKEDDHSNCTNCACQHFAQGSRQVLTERTVSDTLEGEEV